MLLAGDVGGTHARFALYSSDGRRRIHQATLASAEHPSLEAALRRFLAHPAASFEPAAAGARAGSAKRGDRAGRAGAREPIEAAAIGVAGPVIDGRCAMPNLPWVLDQRQLARKLQIPKVVLLNDLVALALGALGLPRRKLALVQGERGPIGRGGNVAMLAAGTGLGEAMLLWDGARLVPSATEGGHTDFAPRDAIEWDLLEFIGGRVGGRVSYERILSGPGIGNLYDFFVERAGVKDSKATERAIAESADRNRTISELGAAGKSKPASRAVDLFLSIYGAEAGNLALKSLATGGVFVGGGIAPKILPALTTGVFMRAFRAKAPFEALLDAVPVKVILHSTPGLLGAANFCSHT